MLTVIYASNDLGERQLTLLGAQIQSEWLISGDFNNVLNFDDRNGAIVTQAETLGFKDINENTQLTLLKITWYHFTCVICMRRGLEYI